MRPTLALLAAAFALLGLAGTETQARPRCTRDYAPVCGRGPEGVRSYNNPNCARSYGARILHAGRCRKDVEPVLPNPYGAEFCPMVDDPVCAERDGARLTFPNLCHARAAGAELVHRGRCEALWPMIGDGVLEPGQPNSGSR